MDSINISCSDDSNVYTSQGGLGGGLADVDAPAGIRRLTGKNGDILDSMQVYSITNNMIKKIGGGGGNLEYSLDCG